ncbi:MAG: 1-deoxy-D-xylulose-5-phosphate reductoisomerase [Bacilli bacterium]|nr:1-deoxy-D-xylulose-5-phosphate reductoisomerase [Bacilli bacterium]MDD2682034.1 1-deoxy-D-xylulose-5-phosphate reductoisomerase [Bacilli bacterium]MDD3121310.1 1-deoxy-D-xylulose-5-phosphate reductoisomerase [Bacilli bacterium]MDD4063439.1 1-deoxy-D-xylulose-5-phosphate reductoisomerase [Bacilli bacterium]MDD4482100.1 1-deoxy-D-xylulose-5-phosphate reductoisomerase [Bacilli bacterium]
MKNIYLLGASGSIGKQTLDVISRYQDKFVLKSFSVNTNVCFAKEIIKKFKPEMVCVGNYEDMVKLQFEFPEVLFSYGDQGLIDVATYSSEDGYLVNAVTGSVGLLPTIEAIKKKRDILLANKETLVIGGELIMPLVKKYNVNLLPIDSEHSAILQCLLAGKKDEVNRIIITASGGAFRNKQREELKYVSKEEALNHPNWKMGRKITIDSASMINKAFEVIEAHYLFDLPINKIETIIHKQSIIHGMVEYVDGVLIAQMAIPDMRIPIEYALLYPNRSENEYNKVDFKQNLELSFEEIDLNRFPLLKLGYEVIEKKGILPTIFNAANEAAVKLFLCDKIKFLDIEEIIISNVKGAKNLSSPTITDIIRVDKEIKEKILRKYEDN